MGPNGQFHHETRGPDGGNDFGGNNPKGSKFLKIQIF